MVKKSKLIVEHELSEFTIEHLRMLRDIRYGLAHELDASATMSELVRRNILTAEEARELSPQLHQAMEERKKDLTNLAEEQRQDTFRADELALYSKLLLRQR